MAPCCSSAEWPSEALAAFEATLKKEPNRLGAMWARPRPPKSSGDMAKARQHYEKIVELSEGVDTVRTEVAEARAQLAAKP